MRSDLLGCIVWLALIVVGPLLFGGEGSTLRLIFWLSIPFVVTSTCMVANGVGLKDLLSRLRIAAPWIIAAVLVSALIGLALSGTIGLVFGSVYGALTGLMVFCFWAIYPPTKKPQ